MKVISSKAKVNIVKVDNMPVLIVDDFLHDPVGMRKYALDIYLRTKNKRIIQGERIEGKTGGAVFEVYPDDMKFLKKYPGFIEGATKFINDNIGDDILNHYDLSDDSDMSLVCNKGPYFNCVIKPPQYLPHVDGGHVSSFTYLNPPAQCWGGTAIYRHMPTGIVHADQFDTSLEWLAEKPLSEPLTESTDEWKLELMVEMKFNRFVAFNGSMIHKIFWPEKGCPYKNDIRMCRMAINNFYCYENRPNN